MWHLATVVFGRSEEAFWAMTPAQIDVLAAAHVLWQGGAGDEPEEGDPNDLIALVRQTNRGR